MERLTVFTPTYNRANTIGRVFESLKRQTYKDFKWVIIDDGSTDDTKSLIASFIESAFFPIEYYYQENRGKHVAINRAVSSCKTELFIIADSDDAFVDNALEVLVKEWDSIPEEKKEDYKGVNCRVFEHETGLPIGSGFPEERFDSTDEIAYFKLKMRSEKWNLFRTEALKEFPFPEIEGAHFYPETVIWQRMSQKYKTRYINECLREYYKDAENSVIHGEKSVRYKENIHLWTHFINNEFQFFRYYPKRFIQSFVGLVRDGYLNGMTTKEILNIPNTPIKKILTFLLLPAGMILYKISKRENS